MSVNDPLEFYIVIIDGIDAQESALFYLPKKRPLTNEIRLGNERNACASH